MSKTWIILLLLVASTGGYLTYDWYTKTNPAVEDQFTYLHSWTDEQGETHFSDQGPPPDAKNVQKIRTRKTLDEPLVTQITGLFAALLCKGEEAFASLTGSKETTVPVSAPTPDYQNYDDQQLKKASGVKRRWGTKKKGKT
jgi:hypothetical protein